MILKKFCFAENLTAKYPKINFQIKRLKEKAIKKMLKVLPKRERVLGGGRNIYNREVDKNQIRVGKSE